VHFKTLNIVRKYSTLSGSHVSSVVCIGNDWIAFIEGKAVKFLPFNIDPRILTLPDPLESSNILGYSAQHLYVNLQHRVSVSADMLEHKLWIFGPKSLSSKCSGARMQEERKKDSSLWFPYITCIVGYNGSPAFSGDGTLAAYASSTNYIKLVTLFPAVKSFTIRGLEQPILAICFSRDCSSIWVAYKSVIASFRLDGKLICSLVHDMTGVKSIMCSHGDEFLIVHIDMLVLILKPHKTSLQQILSLPDREHVALSDDGQELLTVVHRSSRVMRFSFAERDWRDSLGFTFRAERILHLGKIGRVVYCVATNESNTRVFHMWKLSSPGGTIVSEETNPIPDSTTVLSGPQHQPPLLGSAGTVYDMSAFLLSDCFPSWYIQLCMPSVIDEFESWRFLAARPNSIYVRLSRADMKGHSYLSLALSAPSQYNESDIISMIRVILTLPLETFPALAGSPSLLRAAIRLGNPRLIREVLEKYIYARNQQNAFLRYRDPAQNLWRLTVYDIGVSDEICQSLCDLFQDLSC
jgi:hypothetical protein